MRRPAGEHPRRRRPTGRRPGGEDGQVAIVVALMLTVMLAFGALVVDVGLNWAARTQLQSAADAAALAGAAELPGRPDEALAKVRQYLDDNVPGLAGAVGWESDGDAANGDVTCYRPPAAAPPPGDPTHGCSVGDTAIQVITPPLRPAYAFASIVGRRSSEIKALAAAGAPPGAEAPCALCVLSPDANPALLADGDVTLHAAGGGIVVDSDAGGAATTAGTARVEVVAPGTIRVVGGVQSDPGSGFDPAVQTGGLPVADPLSSLPRPDQLTPPKVTPGFPVQADVTLTRAGGFQQLQQGIYHSIKASGNGATLRFAAGVYVITGDMTISRGAIANVGSATLYFACSSYPQPCAGGRGAGLTVSDNASFLATATVDPASPYKGLGIFYDRNNSQDLVLGGSNTLFVKGTVYAPRAKLDLHGDNGSAVLSSMVVVDSLAVSGGAGREFDVAYDPALNVSLRTSGGGLVR